MGNLDNSFKLRVYAVVAQIPKGRIMTYGQIAAICGSPRAARIVGGTAHWGDQSLPWQRVVHKDGSLASGFPGGVEGHKQALIEDNVKIGLDHKVFKMQEVIWQPPNR